MGMEVNHFYKAFKRLSTVSNQLRQISQTFFIGRGPATISLSSFCPETAIFRNFGVNLRACLCGERMFASAQPLDFLDLAENIPFPNQKLY
jgi:hypothetical protein